MYNNFGYAQQPFPTSYVGQSVNTNPKTYCQTLTQEQMDSLKVAQEEFTLGITKEDNLRAICMHRNIEGYSMLEPDPISGEVKCKICGRSFHILDNIGEQDIANAVKNLIDILQTTKTLYYDMPAESATKFYPIIALIEKIPGLYKLAIDNFTKHENAVTGWNKYNTSDFNNFNMLMSGFNPMMYQQPMPGMGMPQQPYGFAQPYGYGQPIPQQNQGNPFGYNGQPVAPAPGYAPQVQGYQYQPVAPAAAPQPAPATVPAVAPQPAPAPAADTVEVSTQFQS